MAVTEKNIIREQAATVSKKSNTVMARIRDTGINIALGLSILIMVISMLTYISPRFGWTASDIVSNSMLPELNRGTLILYRTVDPRTLDIGDIIVFSQAPAIDTPICHRIVDIQQNPLLQFSTEGDANIVPDNFMTPAQNVKGLVVYHIPVAGNLVKFIKTPVGFAVTLLIPGILILAIYLNSLITLLKKKPEDTARR
jgi:signal peptidase